MKKALIITGLIVITFSAVFTWAVKFPPWQIGAAIKISTGLGAKLACSAKHISKLSDAQIIEDLASYSPANRLLDIEYIHTEKRVKASMFGLSEASATFRENIGCALDFGDTSALYAVTAPSYKSLAEAQQMKIWPEGEIVNTILPTVQLSLNEQLMLDNQGGFDTRALLIVKDGIVVAESYAEGFSANSLLLGWSMGKSMTAMMIGHLILQGQLAINDTNLFPQWQNDERKEISLEDLLTMTSGLDFDEVYTPGSDSTHMLFSAYSASDVALASPLKEIPGSHFSYSSGTTNILSRLIYKRVGASAQANIDFLHTHVLSPLGMHHTLFETDSSGVFVGSSYMYASARDWARLGQVMLNNGKLNGHKLVNESWLAQAHSPNNSNNDGRYGYQFWLNQGNGNNEQDLRWPNLPEDAYAMMGNRGQVVMIIPSSKTVIVRLGWSASHYNVNERFASFL